MFFFKSAITFLAVYDFREAKLWKNRPRQGFMVKLHSDIFDNFDKLVSKNIQSDRCVIACSTAEASSHESTSSTTGARSSEIVSFAAGAPLVEPERRW